jgi:hypothetical protein
MIESSSPCQENGKLQPLRRTTTKKQPADMMRAVIIRSQGLHLEITDTKIKDIADALGIFLGKIYWYGRSGHEDYRAKEIGSDATSWGKMIAHLRRNHFKHIQIFSFRRVYSYEQFGDALKKGQRIVCFDIDGHKGEDTQAAVRFLHSMFPEDKYIEYNPKSNGYHVYYHFDRPVFDYSLNNLREFCLKRGHNIDPVTSERHMRFPFSTGYSVYGLYDSAEPNLIFNFNIDSLLGFWKDYSEYAYFDPTFEAIFPEEPMSGSKRKKTNHISGLKERLIANPVFDFGPGERHGAVLRILRYCLMYRLSEEDYEDICEAHNKGARGKTDYHKLYNWGLSHFEGASAPTTKIDFSAFIQRVYHYSKIKALPEDISTKLEKEMDQSLVRFLSGRKNLCPAGSFKNEGLARRRYGELVRLFVLFLCQLLDAKDKEISAMRPRSPEFILPMVFQHRERGIPLAQSFIKFLGKHFKCRAFPEIKAYLEYIGWISPIPLNDRGATYVEGRCIYYSMDFMIEDK